MNTDLITLNEVLNDGTRIFFYREETTSVWVTWGCSAYLLAHMKGVRCSAGFSDKMQMPCVCIAHADFRSIMRDNRKALEDREAICVLPVDTTVDARAYRNWAASLK